MGVTGFERKLNWSVSMSIHVAKIVKIGDKIINDEEVYALAA